MDRRPHAPLHWFKRDGFYILTGGTYLKCELFTSSDNLEYLQDLMFELAGRNETELHGWAFFPNHYHLIVESPRDPSRLQRLIREFHSISAHELNRSHNALGRRVWYQYWDTYLDDERSYFSRLNYVNQNPAHHGIVQDAITYRWCSAGWLEANAKRSFIEALREFGADRITLRDDF